MLEYKCNSHCFHLQVSDFGLARYVDSNHEGGKFPIKWTSPEALRESVSDIFICVFSLFFTYSFTARFCFMSLKLSHMLFISTAQCV